MNKDYVHNLFKSLEGTFDVHETPEGHQKRFLERLNAQNRKSKKAIVWWKPLSIAASVVVLFGLGFTFLNPPAEASDLASISPEMAQTQTFFTTTINKELTTLKNQTTPETKALVDDAMQQMEVLEQEYEKLKVDLLKSGNDKRVIYAMIANFQNRIELLEQVLQTIEKVKNLNNPKDEITV